MGRVLFITGGVRSGKSAFAEYYAKELYTKYNSSHLIYIASGVAFDEEMKSRITRHKQDREVSEIEWITVELADEVPTKLDKFQNNSIVLWDCITTWLSNVLYKTQGLNKINRLNQIEHHLNEFKQQIISWKGQDIVVILVSNEVLDEQLSDFSEVNLYRQILGDLHQWIVAISDETYEIDYSLKRQWK